MHNIHLLVVKAENGKEACDKAESMLIEWGDENNWRRFEGAISENNEFFVNEGEIGIDRSFREGRETIAAVNKSVEGWMKRGKWTVGKDALTLIKKAAKGGKLTEHEWWLIKEYAESEWQRKGRTKFNVLEDGYFSGHYDEPGVTHLEMDDEPGKKWVVFMDMHH